MADKSETLKYFNTILQLSRKNFEYFDNGCRLVWVINPDEQSVLVYRQPQPDRLLKIADNLDGEDVIPGFTLPVSELFAEFDF